MTIDRPSVINWMYSGNCNMSCRFCYGLFNSDRLTLPQKHYIVDKIGDAEVPKLVLTGGEPLLGEGIYEIIDHAQQRGIFVSLHTNGLLLGASALDKLEGKVGRISLALDGSTNNVNYTMRGVKGYFDLVRELMGEIKRRGIPLSIKTVATKRNIRDIPYLAAVLAEYTPDVWLISEFLPRHRGKTNKEDFALTDEEFRELEAQLQIAPFEISFRSLQRRSNRPFFFLDSNGNAYTELTEDNTEVKVGSILEDEVLALWAEIININPVNDYYRETSWTVKSDLSLIKQKLLS